VLLGIKNQDISTEGYETSQRRTKMFTNRLDFPSNLNKRKMVKEENQDQMENNHRRTHSVQ